MSRWWHRIRAWWDGITGEASERYDTLCLNPILLDALYEEPLARHYLRLRSWEPRALVCASLQPPDPALASEIEQLAARVRVLCLQLQRLAHLTHCADPNQDPVTCRRLRDQYSALLSQRLTLLEESVEACSAADWRAEPDRALARRAFETHIRAANAAISASIARLAWTLPRSQPCLRAWVAGDPPPDDPLNDPVGGCEPPIPQPTSQ